MRQSDHHLPLLSLSLSSLPFLSLLLPSFHQKLEHRYSSSYFKEIDEAGNMIRDWHDELGESQSCEPIRIIADDVTGGQVAVLISEVYNIHNTKEVSE